MSLLCLCVIELGAKEERLICKNQLCEIAEQHQRGIAFLINWPEPFTNNIKGKNIIVSLTDSPDCTECENLLLPDGWYYNGKNSATPFRKRMQFLLEIAKVLHKNNYNFSFYIGTSGTEEDEFIPSIISYQDLDHHLETTIGVDGAEIGQHIIVNRTGDGVVS